MKLSNNTSQVTDCNKQKRNDKSEEKLHVVNTKINQPTCVIRTHILPEVYTRSEDKEIEQNEGEPAGLDNSEYPAELDKLESSRSENNSSFEYPALIVERSRLDENPEVLEAFVREIPDITCETGSSIAPNEKVDQIRNLFEEISKMKANGLKNFTAKPFVVEIKSYSDKKKEEEIRRCSIENCPQKMVSPPPPLSLSEKNVSGISSRKQSGSSNSSFSSIEQPQIDKIIQKKTHPEILRSSGSSQGSDGVLPSETKSLDGEKSQCVEHLNGKHTPPSNRPVSSYFDPTQFNFPVGLDTNLKPSEFLKTVDKKPFPSSLMTKKHSVSSNENIIKINTAKSRTNIQTKTIEDFAKNVEIVEKVDVPFTKKNDIEVSNHSGNQESWAEEKKKRDILQETLGATNKPVFSITKEQLQSVNLKKTEKASSDDRTVLLKINRSTPVKKNDIIAEFKSPPVDIDVLRRPKEERMKLEIEEKNKNTPEIPKDCQTENFIETITEKGSYTDIPQWKRQMLAKRASEKAHKMSVEEMQRAEDQKINTVPEWKRVLMRKSLKSSSAAPSRNNESHHKPLVNVTAAKDNLDYGTQTNFIITEGDKPSNPNFENFKKNNRTGSL
ncbi:uncharacterized protein LOC111089940 isoform X2 [Limulus polyphemus]|uniref:Uncharacterized protein LOC111089940 isoform X2 n=1 Tax=Limulus polyphemus TaxID=6850 RepID=A0ABM1TSU4_LIMPO|nr:uncharacterized protein LOC111089940 isoform X2 [Limulus polyphemus]